MASKDKKQRVVTLTRVSEEVLKRLGSGAKDVTYGELAKALGRSPRARSLAVALGKIQRLCSELELPCLPAVVVRTDDPMPGEGFYDLYEIHFSKLHKRPSERAKDVRREQRKVRKVDLESWKPLIEAAEIADACDNAIA